MPHEKRELERERQRMHEYQPPRTSKHLPDHVSNPPHYVRNGIDKEKAVRAMLEGETDPYRAHLRASILKYVWRIGQKDAPLTDAQKARQYVQWLAEHEEQKDAGG